MRNKNTILSGIFLCLLSVIDLTFVAAASANTVSITEQLGYKKQLAHYLKTQQKNNTPRITYNIGVLYYKLKQYSESRTYFTKLLKVENYHALAQYNLGLLAYKSGDKKQAISWFERISEHQTKYKTPEKLLQLATVQIKKLRTKKATKKTIKKKTKDKLFKINSYVFAYYGHDDNLIDPNGNVITGDNFLNTYASVAMKFKKPPLKDFSWRFGFYSKDHVNLGGYDYRVISSEIGKKFYRDNWRHGLGFRLDSSTYGVTDYQSTARIELNTRYKKSSNQLAARYRYYDIQSEDPLYDAYEGSRQLVSLRYEKKFSAQKIRLTLDFETNDRADLRTAGIVTTSYSAARDTVALSWFSKLSDRWKMRLSLKSRDSLYNDFSTADNARRKEELKTTSLQFKYNLKKRWWFVADYSYSDNQSNIDRYSYSRNVSRVGISGSF